MTKYIRSDFIVFLFIFICVFFSYNTIVNAYYLFHDDWTLFFLEKENLIETIKDHRYRAAHTEMGRPLGHAFFAMGPFFIEKLNDGNIVRLFSLLLTSVFGYTIFKNLNFLNYEKIFSISFVILFLLTPPFYILNYQISGQYILICLIFSSIFMLLVINYFQFNNTLLESRKNKKLAYILLALILIFGCLVNPRFFIFSSIYLFIYYIIIIFLCRKNYINRKDTSTIIILSILLYFSLSIYATAALIIYSLAPLILFASNIDKTNSQKINFILRYMIFITSIIFLYFISLKTFIFFEDAHSGNIGRAISIDFNFINKIIFYFTDVFPNALSLWRIDTKFILVSYLLIPLVLLSYFILVLRSVSIRHSLLCIFIIVLSLILTIAPVIFIEDNYFAPYRSMIGHMFLLYFLLIFLFFNLFNKFKFWKYIVIFLITYFIYLYGNWPNNIIRDKVIQPTEKELHFINNKIKNLNIAGKIKSGEKITVYFNKLNTHSINNNVIQNIPVLAASGRGSPWIPEIIYSLLYDKHDIKYNLKRSDLKEKIVYEYLNKEKIQCISVSFPWGILIYSDNVQVCQKNGSTNSLLIDMNKMEK